MLIAAGSANGIISIWDYEMSKLCGLWKGKQSAVICLKFVDPYPLLLASY